MKRILVTDDDEMVRYMLRKALERAGYEVVDAPDGKQGMKLCNEKSVDLVITDIFMPEKEGIETILDFKRRFPDMKIIAISGGGRGRLVPEVFLGMAKEFGAIRVFTKPIDLKELLVAVQELLSESL